MNFAFFGSPLFSKIVLETLIDDNFYPLFLICNPDKPFGRKKIITPPPTKQLILSQKEEIKNSIKILQPEKKEDLLKLTKEGVFKETTFAVVAAYSKIIPSEVLNSFSKGVIGIHPSLLPKYRGPSPIQSMILDREKEIGISIYLLDEEMDHGPILAQRKLSLENHNLNYSDLEYQLGKLAGKTFVEIINDFLEGKIKPYEQDHKKATFTKKFSTEDGFVDLEKDDPFLIERKIRALSPDPGVYTFINGERFKILEAIINNEGKVIITKIVPAGKKERKVNIILPLH